LKEILSTGLKDQLFTMFSDGLEVDLFVVAERSSSNLSEKSAESSSSPLIESRD
jgi:hypothetical protein